MTNGKTELTEKALADALARSAPGDDRLAAVNAAVLEAPRRRASSTSPTPRWTPPTAT